MRAAILLLLLLPLVTPAAADAGVIYDFVTSTETERGKSQTTGRVFAEGKAYRAELAPDPSRSYDVVLTPDGDDSTVLLNRAQRTWSYRVRVGKDVRSSILFRWPVANAKVKGKPAITHRNAGSETVAGRRVTKHIVDVRFKVVSRAFDAPVNGSLRATATMWIDADLPVLVSQPNLRTGYAEVDTKLEAIYTQLSGMILRHELEVARVLDGGPPVTEVTKSVVTKLEVTDVPPEMFVVPADYTHK